MFFYPGHGSFIGESLLMAVLYAYCAGTLVFLNKMKLWEREKPLTVVRTEPAAVASSSNDAATSSKSTSTILPKELSLTEQHAANEVAQWLAFKRNGGQRPAGTPTTATVTAVLREIAKDRKAAAAAAGGKDSDEYVYPFALTPALWVMFLVFTFHFAFSVIRAIYTRKNGRYRWGYLI
jgi:hypothetical protein